MSYSERQPVLYSSVNHFSFASVNLSRYQGFTEYNVYAITLCILYLSVHILECTYIRISSTSFSPVATPPHRRESSVSGSAPRGAPRRCSCAPFRPPNIVRVVVRRQSIIIPRPSSRTTTTTTTTTAAAAAAAAAATAAAAA